MNFSIQLVPETELMDVTINGVTKRYRRDYGLKQIFSEMLNLPLDGIGFSFDANDEVKP